MSQKERELSTFDEVCQKVSRIYGTLRTNGLDYDYWVKKHMEKCEAAGAKRDEITSILDKYRN